MIGGFTEGMVDLLKLIKEIRNAFTRSEFYEVVSKITPKRAKNLANAFISRKTGKILFSPPRPTTLFIEVVRGCNYNCVGCRAGGLFEKKFMPFSKFKEILDEFDDAIFIFPYGIGEPFLHKQIYDMLSYAVKKNFVVLPFSNFSVISPEKLIETGISKIFVSLDSVNPEKFSKIRENGKLEIVIRNIKRVQDEKRKRGIKTPEILLNCTLMKENMDEVEDIIELSLSLGINKFFFQTLYKADFMLKEDIPFLGSPPDTNDIQKFYEIKEKYKKKAKIFFISHYDSFMGDYFSGYCQFAFSTLMIDVDGGTYPCICGTTPKKRDYHGIFWNIFDNPNKALDKREEFIRNFRESQPEFCKGCSLYYRNV